MAHWGPVAGQTPSETLTDPAQARTLAAEDEGRDRARPPDSDAYELDGELARGGMGRIWRARDRRLDRPVAVKQLLRPTPEMIQLFEREVRITARLQHPAIVSVYEAGQLPTGEPFFAMKLVAGRSLKEVVREAGSRNERLALLPAVIAVADALAYAHDQGVIHRDLKPSNVLVGDFGETVVIDWGLATIVGDARRTSGPTDVAGPEPIVGTPSYMAPEVAAGAAADERTDVYAIGAILYEVLSGSPPYRGGRSDQVLAEVRGGPPQPLDRRQPDLPRDLTAIVDKAMARDPAARYPSARELAAELRRFQTGQLVSAHHYSLRERVRRFVARHRGAVAVALAAVAALVVLSAIGLGRIVRERDRARERADRLALAQARQLLEHDPAQALAALRELSPGSPLWGAARVIAADALHRGPGRIVYRERRAPIVALAAPAGRVRLVLAEGELLHVVDPAAAPAEDVALSGHTGGALAVALSPDGAELASVDGNGDLALWALDPAPRLLAGTGARATGGGARATVTPAPATALTIAPDGGAVAAAMRDGGVRIQVAGAAERRLPGVGAPVVKLALMGGAARLAWATADGVVHLTDLATLADAVVAREQAVQLLAFAPRGDRLAVGAGRVLRLIEPDSGRLIEIGHDGEVEAVAFAPDGQLATGASDGVVRIWSPRGQLRRRLAGHRGPVRQVAFSPDGKMLVSAGDDRDVRTWDTAAGGERIFAAHPGWGSALWFAGDDRLVTAGWDHRVVAHQLDSGTSTPLGAHAAPVRALIAVPAAGWAASAGDDRTVRRWPLDGGAPQIAGSHQGAVLALAAPDDGRFLVSGGADHDVRLWGGRTGSLARAASAVHTVATSADGKVVLWACADQVGLHWEGLNGTTALDLGAPITAAALARHGHFAAAGRRDGRVSLLFIDKPGENPRKEDYPDGPAGAPVRAIAFSPDSRRLAWAGDDGAVHVLTLRGRGLRRLVGHRDLVRRIAFSPDGLRLATASDDGSVRLWDIASGEGRALVRPGWVADVAFAPDGEQVASIGEDGHLHVDADRLPRQPAALRREIGGRAAELAPPAQEAR